MIEKEQKKAKTYLRKMEERRKFKKSWMHILYVCEKNSLTKMCNSVLCIYVLWSVW